MTHVMSGCINEPTSLSFSSTPEDYSLNYIPYPVQNSIPYFPNKLKTQCLADLDELNNLQILNNTGRNSESTQEATNREPKTDENFGEFSAKIFGKTVQSIFIRPYNEKVEYF